MELDSFIVAPYPEPGELSPHFRKVRLISILMLFFCHVTFYHLRI